MRGDAGAGVYQACSALPFPKKIISQLRAIVQQDVKLFNKAHGSYRYALFTESLFLYAKGHTSEVTVCVRIMDLKACQT
jgi:hypothetical protein